MTEQPPADDPASGTPAAEQPAPEQPPSDTPTVEIPSAGTPPATDIAPAGPPSPTAPQPVAPRPGPPAYLSVYPAPAPAASGPAGSGSRPTGWLWVAVTALALVIGLVSGFAGSAIYRHVSPETPVGGSAEGLAGSGTVTAAPITGRRSSVTRVARALLPSTVQISAEYDGQAGGATGSGFVLDSSGHVITNNHVVEQAAKDDGPIEIVDQDGDRYPATIVGRSPVYDIAVLYASDVAKLQPAPLGDSASLRVGDPVVAFGSPLGLSSTVTAGIVSALQRPVTTGDSSSEQSFIDAVQTDAAINPGNSGGPLVDMAGRVVGVNSAIATTGGGSTTSAQSGNIGVGFAIPISQVKVTADQILRTGHASYPVIGARVATGDSDGGDDGNGARVSQVVADGPAAAAGLRTGDVVTAIGGERVPDGIALIVAIRAYQPGQTVTLAVRRDDTDREVSVTLGAETG